MARIGFTLLLVAAVLLGGCATVAPQPPSEAALADVTPDAARKGEGVGSLVRWGGVIVQVGAEKDRTCFTVLSRRLDASGQPLPSDETFGRFIACSGQFYDPAAYERGREVSFVGTVVPPTEGKVGEREYRFARLDAAKVYLWPRRVTVVPAYDPFGDYPYYRYPFFRPWPYRYR